LLDGIARAPALGATALALALAGCGADNAPRSDGALGADTGFSDAGVAHDAAADDVRPAPGDAAGSDVPGPQWTYPVPTCPSEDPAEAPFLAPIPDGRGNYGCFRVGALRVASAPSWPDPMGLRAPIVYVRPGPPAVGDGTSAHPYASFADALAAAVAPATIALPTGVFIVPDTVALAGSLTVVGTGDTTLAFGGTTGALFEVGGVAAQVTISGVTLTGDPAHDQVGLHVTGGAYAALTDVRIDTFAQALLVDGASEVRGDRVTVWQPGRTGVALREGSRGTLKGLLVRDGGGVGVLAADAALNLTETMVAAQAGAGVALLGVSPSAQDALERVAVIGDHTAGLYVAGTRAVRATLLAACGTQVAGGDVSGAADGIVVRDGARVELDPVLGDGVPESARPMLEGTQSLILANARLGALASGVRGATPTALVLHGAVVGSNRGGGVILQSGATSESVAFNTFRDNVGIGLGAFSDSWVASFQCNYHGATRLGTLPLRSASGGAAETYGDGLVVAATMLLPHATMEGARFEDNARFGALLVRADVAITNSSATGNGVQGVAQVSAAVSGDDSNLASTPSAMVAPSALPAGDESLAAPAIGP
jgi:hypothetical protein